MSRSGSILDRCRLLPERRAAAAFLANPPAGGVGETREKDLRVLCLRQARFPHLRFEYHPVAQKVFIIRLDVKKGDKPFAEIIGWQVKDSGTAWNIMLVWLRGYQHAMAERNLSAAEQQERSGYVLTG